MPYVPRGTKQEPVKKADRKVRPPGDVLLVTITMLNIAVLLISDSKRREVRCFVSVSVRAQEGEVDSVQATLACC